MSRKTEHPEDMARWWITSCVHDGSPGQGFWRIFMHYGVEDGGDAYDQHMRLILDGDIPEEELHARVLLELDELLGFNCLNDTQ